jgi:hypothetical protein
LQCFNCLGFFSVAPHLRDLHLTLFNQPALSIPHIAEFIHAHSASDSPPDSKPVPTLVLAEFSESSASLALIPPAPTPTPTSSSVGSASNTQRATSPQKHSAGDTRMKQKVLALEEAIKQGHQMR